MSTLETQYIDFISLNTECEWNFEQWLEYNFSHLKEFNEWNVILLDGLDDDDF
jgi:hypothetical protein